MRTPLAASARAEWSRSTARPSRPPGPTRGSTAATCSADHLVLTLRRDGEQLLVITDHDGGNVREIPPSVTAGSIRVEHAEDYDRGSVIIAEQSLIEPLAWYELDLDTGAEALAQADGGSRLRSGAVPDRAHHRAGAGRHADPGHAGPPSGRPLDGSAPCLLYGYGAYEASIDPEFERSLPSLLDRGVVYAIAHIRGGGEGGRHWWQQGQTEAKPTTFTDYIAVADWLAGAVGRRQPDRGRGDLRRRAAPGRRLLDAARPVARGRRRGAVRRLRDDDARRLDPADHQRVGGMGRSARSPTTTPACGPTRPTTIRPPGRGRRCW